VAELGLNVPWWLDVNHGYGERLSLHRLAGLHHDAQFLFRLLILLDPDQIGLTCYLVSLGWRSVSRRPIELRVLDLDLGQTALASGAAKPGFLFPNPAIVPALLLRWLERLLFFEEPISILLLG